MSLGVLEELTAILLSMHKLNVDDVTKKCLGFNMFDKTQFVYICLRQGITIILPDIEKSKNFIYHDTNTKEGKRNMILDLAKNGYCEYDIAKFLDMTGNEVRKIIGGSKNE